MTLCGKPSKTSRNSGQSPGRGAASFLTQSFLSAIRQREAAENGCDSTGIAAIAAGERPGVGLVPASAPLPATSIPRDPRGGFTSTTLVDASVSRPAISRTRNFLRPAEDIRHHFDAQDLCAAWCQPQRSCCLCTPQSNTSRAHRREPNECQRRNAMMEISLLRPGDWRAHLT